MQLGHKEDLALTSITDIPSYWDYKFVIGKGIDAFQLLNQAETLQRAVKLHVFSFQNSVRIRTQKILGKIRIPTHPTTPCAVISF